MELLSPQHVSASLVTDGTLSAEGFCHSGKRLFFHADPSFADLHQVCTATEVACLSTQLSHSAISAKLKN